MWVFSTTEPAKWKSSFHWRAHFKKYEKDSLFPWYLKCLIKPASAFFCMLQCSEPQKLFNIANELLHTEEAYVKRLHLLDQVTLRLPHFTWFSLCVIPKSHHQCYSPVFCDHVRQIYFYHSGSDCLSWVFAFIQCLQMTLLCVSLLPLMHSLLTTSTAMLWFLPHELSKDILSGLL